MFMGFYFLWTTTKLYGTEERDISGSVEDTFIVGFGLFMVCVYMFHKNIEYHQMFLDHMNHENAGNVGE